MGEMADKLAELRGRHPEVLRVVRFVLVGGSAFVVDAGVLWVGVHVFDVHALVARFGSILLAMVVGWWGHRSITFAAPGAPSWREFGGYAWLSAWVVALNYAVFAGCVWAGMGPILAVGLASGVSMVANFCGMRWGLFKAAA
jgi:putative flippase GtrA